MSGRLRMYDVEFGDGFLLYGEGENLLVDLGSIDQSFPFDPVRDSIRNESAGGELSLLLTHFHRDHWSGLEQKRATHKLPRLSMVYLPDLFGMRVPGKLDALVRSLLGDFLKALALGTTMLRTKPQYTLADLLREVLPGLPLNRIELLSRGGIFPMGGKEYQVLWPELPACPRGPHGQLREFLKELDGRLAAHGTELRVVDTLEKMADALLKEFGSWIEHPGESVRIGGGPYEEWYERTERMVELLRREEDDEFWRKVHHYAGTLSKGGNEASVVFHERLPGGVLMTGDAPAPVLDKLVNKTAGSPFLHDEYDVIKAPHHGTGSYFCAILPDSRYFCISNGAGNRGFSKVTEKYEHVYGCVKGRAIIYCTSCVMSGGRCEYVQNGNPCPNPLPGPPTGWRDITW